MSSGAEELKRGFPGKVAESIQGQDLKQPGLAQCATAWHSAVPWCGIGAGASGQVSPTISAGQLNPWSPAETAATW